MIYVKYDFSTFGSIKFGQITLRTGCTNNSHQAHALAFDLFCLYSNLSQ